MLTPDYLVSSVTCIYVLPYKCCQHVIMCHPCYSFNWTSVSWNCQLVFPFCCPQMQGVIIASRQYPKLKNIHHPFKGNYLSTESFTLSYINNNKNNNSCYHHVRAYTCACAHARTHTRTHTTWQQKPE